MTISTTKAFILGSAPGVRRLDSDKSYPVALLEGRAGKRLLDWTLIALSEAGIDAPVFVGGYHIEKVVQAYPELRLHFNPDWEDGSALSALRAIRTELTGSCLIVEADVVFRASTVRALLESTADVAVACCERAGSLAEALQQKDTVARLSAHGTAVLRAYLEGVRALEPAPTLSQVLAGLGLDGEVVWGGSDLARVTDRRDLSRFVLGTKAQTLDRLRPLLRSAKIHDQVRFTVGEWRADPGGVLTRLAKDLPAASVIVRSSAISEDSFESSQAGMFRSEVAGTPGGVAVETAIDVVIESFLKGGATDDRNQVFVQPFLDKMRMSGVLFSRDPESGAPYITINYDDTTGRTDTVTSGGGDRLRTAIVYRRAETPELRPEFRRLVNVVAELEDLVGEDALDIEFGFDGDGGCHLFQVRPLILAQDGLDPVDADIDDELQALAAYIEDVRAPRSHLAGDSTIFANMPDWNPAEIIGTSPRPLAWSLYRHLITDGIWGDARAALGYFDTFPEPLIVLLAGHPYVDTRASLNSFVPASLDPELRRRVVNHGLEWLRAHPTLHDKLEFEVAVTCLDFDFDRPRRRLLADGFSAKDVEAFRRAMCTLTDDVVSGRRTTVSGQMGLLHELERRRVACLHQRRDSFAATARTVRILLDDCKRFGTLPFSILARFAFIGTSLIRSLRTRGVLSAEEFDELLTSMPTVAGEMTTALAAVTRGDSTVDRFLRHFGHLRPGTYDLLSPSYAEAPAMYLAGLEESATGERPAGSLAVGREIFRRHATEINALIAEAGFTFDAETLQEFVLESVPARERAKFEFTKCLSAALSLLREAGSTLGLSADDMSFVPIERLLVLATDSPSSTLRREIERVIGFNRKRYALHRAIKLPHMLERPGDTTAFELLEWLPNFVGGRSVRAPIVDVDRTGNVAGLRGAIALIRSADPGYDWIFARGIAGLITQYGGVASHMAIRAGELGLPAAIGCGEILYERVRGARLVELDCAAQQIRFVL